MSDRLAEPETFMSNVDGYTLRVAHWSRAESTLPPVLFFSGIGANIELVAGIGDMFPERSIVTLDMPGIGLSPLSQLPYSSWMAARWATKILDELDYETVDVIGMSWGGALAQQFAHQYPSRVSSLVLCATSTGIAGAVEMPSSMMDLFGMSSLTNMDVMQENLMKLYGEVADPNASDHFDSLIMPHPCGVTYQLMAFSTWNSLSFAPALQARTLVLAGRDDRIVPEANAILLHAAIPDAELHVVEDGGHMFFVTHAEQVATRISAFHAN